VALPIFPFLTLSIFAFAACSASSVEESSNLMRHEGPKRVSIDQHSHVQMMEDEPASMAAVSSDIEDPCSSLGCNSHKCAWASGGVITRLVAKKACSNAVALGNSDGKGAAATTMLKIGTLKECMNAVRLQTGGSCSGHFQLHKDTMTCSCVPAKASCTETEDANVCRYQVVEA